MTPELAARRLSAALGRKIQSDDIESVVNEYVHLKAGETFALYAGNARYAGQGLWMKNGEEWDDATPRPFT